MIRQYGDGAGELYRLLLNPNVLVATSKASEQ